MRKGAQRWGGRCGAGTGPGLPPGLRPAGLHFSQGSAGGDRARDPDAGAWALVEQGAPWNVLERTVPGALVPCRPASHTAAGEARGAGKTHASPPDLILFRLSALFTASGATRSIWRRPVRGLQQPEPPHGRPPLCSSPGARLCRSEPAFSGPQGCAFPGPSRFLAQKRGLGQDPGPRGPVSGLGILHPLLPLGQARVERLGRGWTPGA